MCLLVISIRDDTVVMRLKAIYAAPSDLRARAYYE